MSKIEEIFLPILGTNGNYLVSNMGRVKSMARTVETSICSYFRPEKILKPILSQFGYYRIGYRTNKKLKYYHIHRLVAFAFVDNPEKKPFVNHKNGIKTDNYADNLEWCTSSENIKHAFKNNLSNQSGERNATAKLTNKKAIEIFNSSLSYNELMSLFGVSKQTICSIKTGRSWSKITGASQRRQERLSAQLVMEIFTSSDSAKTISDKNMISKSIVYSIRSGKYYSKITGKIYDRSN